MNFFQKRNNIIVSFDESDWTDLDKFKKNMDELLNNSKVDGLKLSAKTVPSGVDLRFIEIILTFSSLVIRKGIQLTWIITPQVNQLIEVMGWNQLMGNIEVKEIEHG
ncbi:MAG: hypothetical protein JJT78_06375 [Leptospira sp.]|nr:hypothetical protein [Leptospira sp.]